jgi:multidrug efflux pump subunit AcrB
MRVNLRPDKMAQLGLTASDVSTAIKAQNIQAPVGAIGSRPTENEQEFKYSANAKGRLKTPEEFGEIIVATKNGENLKLKDIASISEGERMDSPLGEISGGSSVIFPVSLTTDANSIECVKQIREALKEAESRFPADMKLVVVRDNTEYIVESLTKVGHTFVEALVLVLLVVYIFLGNWRATLVPMLAVPVSLIGTFASFMLLGFTINTLTLFAMILAIGLVVDDAIVVVEAVEHHIQETGLGPKEATYRAMSEVSGPVVAIAFVLAAVFIPVSFMGGSTGQLYKQFAITISVSMALSAICALTLTPALCALFLKPQKSVVSEDASKLKNPVDKFIYKFNVWYANLLDKYTSLVGKFIKHSKLVLLGLVVSVL